MEHLQVGAGGAGGGRRPRFYEHQGLPVAFRSRNACYHLSGYDRGHMAPAADFTARGALVTDQSLDKSQGDTTVGLSDNDTDNGEDSDSDCNGSDSDEEDEADKSQLLPNKRNQERAWNDELMHTYNLCNVSPQHHDLNRGLWLRLEDWVRRIARESPEYECVVVTGPLWLPAARVVPDASPDRPGGNNSHMQLTFKGEQVGSTTSKVPHTPQKPYFVYQYPAIGHPPNVVAVPTHFFKLVVLISPTDNAIHRFACFVVSNGNNQMGNKNKSLDLGDYCVEWTALEAVAGLVFFPTLTTEEWKLEANKATRMMQGTLTTLDGDNKSDRHGRLLQDGIAEHGNFDTSSHPLLLPQSSPARYTAVTNKSRWMFGSKKTDIPIHLCINGGCKVGRKQKQSRA
jgi:DNA/RNA endonuclease G (NUC1)